MWVERQNGNLINLDKFNEVVLSNKGVVAVHTDADKKVLLFGSSVIGEDEEALRKIRIGLATGQNFVSLKDV